MKKPILTALALAPMAAFAQPIETWHAKTLGEALGYTALFGLAGAIMVVLGFKAFDKIITRIDLEGEIKRGNVAAGLLAGAVIIGLAVIIAAAMG